MQKVVLKGHGFSRAVPDNENLVIAAEERRFEVQCILF